LPPNRYFPIGLTKLEPGQLFLQPRGCWIVSLVPDLW
jgi:hypothetical protein